MRREKTAAEQCRRGLERLRVALAAEEDPQARADLKVKVEWARRELATAESWETGSEQTKGVPR